MTRLRAIAEAAGYFPFINGPHRVERGPRTRYFREYSRARYHADPLYRARKIAASVKRNRRLRAAKLTTKSRPMGRHAPGPSGQDGSGSADNRDQSG